MSRFPANLSHRKLRELPLFPAIFSILSRHYPHLGEFSVTAVMGLALGEMFICSKVAAKSFGDGGQAIDKDKESDLGPVASF